MGSHRRRRGVRLSRLTLVMAAATLTFAVLAVVVLLLVDPGCYRGNLGPWC